MPSVADLLKKQIASKTAQAKRKADTPVTTPDQILTNLINEFENRDEIQNKDSSPKQAEQISGTKSGTKSGTPYGTDTNTLAVQNPVQNPDSNSSVPDKNIMSSPRPTIQSNVQETNSVQNAVQPQANDISKNYSVENVGSKNFNQSKASTTKHDSVKKEAINVINRGTISGTKSGTDSLPNTVHDAVRSPVQNPVRADFEYQKQTASLHKPVRNPAHSPVQNPVVNPVPNEDADSALYLRNKLLTLTGLRKNILKHFILKSLENGNHSTGLISYNHIAKSTNSSYESVRGTIRRLKAEGLLYKISKNSGRSGFVEFEIPRGVLELFNQLELQASQGFAKDIQGYSGTNTGTLLGTNTGQYAPSSISSNYNTTSTRELISKEVSYVEQILPDEWKSFSDTNLSGIDIEPIADIGFTEAHLKQIYTRKLCSREILQESIYRFAFDLSENNKGASIKSSALGLFMGVMNRQGEYAKPDNYKSPREIAAERRAKEIQAEDERISKLKAATFDAEFNVWWNGLSSEEQKQIAPSSQLGERHRMTKARVYYRSEILGETKEAL